ncbi:MAG: DNA-3-methyladenine glycosylase 2 family protein [Gemmatimonadetes bacterium]|nr:DNA-3-methyladenine glycosylase 2 family protein [Gemmatimonadota bacterium]MYG86150.1 DNA-3-methyladenine glycosylase 2 family protein [Gemmatimonadota bacterium]MYJ90350.1 DNA-3-methyladenine glycosylase 2 family protein [Gemmatimonadota bacterium]
MQGVNQTIRNVVHTVADSGTIIDFEATLDRYRRYGTDLANRFEAGVFSKVVRTAGGPCLLSLYGVEDRIELRLTPPDGAARSGSPAIDEVSCEVLDEAIKAAGKILGLSFPLQAFYAFASGDPVLSAAVENHHGLRPNLQVDPFEMIVSSITAQQINLGFAYTVRSRLVAEYGEPHVFSGETHYAFPTPDRMAEAVPGDLLPLQFSRQKERYILNLARSIREGEIDLAGLAEKDDASVERELTALVGIGRWTADWFLARYLGRGNVIAAGDLAVKRSIERHYFNGERISEDQIRDFADRWGDYTNLAVQYLLADYGSGGT